MQNEAELKQAGEVSKTPGEKSDGELKWRRRYPVMGGYAPLVLRDEEVKAFVDAHMPVMTFTEMEIACRARFGSRKGLSRGSLHKYWIQWYPHGEKSTLIGKARHRRGTVLTVERDPSMALKIRTMSRLGKPRLIWELLVREFGVERTPSLASVRRYVKRALARRLGDEARPSAVELDDAVWDRVVRCLRCGTPRIIHEIILLEYGNEAPKRAERVQEYLQKLKSLRDRPARRVSRGMKVR